MTQHNPRCAIYRDPPGLRSAEDCNCGVILPLPQDVLVKRRDVETVIRLIDYRVDRDKLVGEVNREIDDLRERLSKGLRR